MPSRNFCWIIAEILIFYVFNINYFTSINFELRTPKSTFGHESRGIKIKITLVYILRTSFVVLRSLVSPNVHSINSYCTFWEIINMSMVSLIWPYPANEHQHFGFIVCCFSLTLLVIDLSQPSPMVTSTNTLN